MCIKLYTDFITVFEWPAEEHYGSPYGCHCKAPKRTYLGLSMRVCLMAPYTGFWPLQRKKIFCDNGARLYNPPNRKSELNAISTWHVFLILRPTPTLVSDSIRQTCPVCKLRAGAGNVQLIATAFFSLLWGQSHGLG